jgi:hypothetical protein
MHAHHHGRDRGWRHFEAMGRRGFRGFQNFGGFGDWSGFGDNFRIGKMLASGDLRLVALYLRRNRRASIRPARASSIRR